MSHLPTPSELDDKVAGLLAEAISQLQRGFAEGVGLERDFPRTMQEYKRIGDVLDKEAAIEVKMSIHDKLADATTTGTAQHRSTSPVNKHVCCFVDGSSNSYDALRWAVIHLVGPQDILHLVSIMPFQEYEQDAQRILQEAIDYSNGVGGIAANHLTARALQAKDSSSTSGVGESIKTYVQDNNVDVVVLGCRGLGSIKKSLLSAVGMGSVTDYCVGNLMCPVMVVKGTEAELQSVGKEEDTAMAT